MLPDSVLKKHGKGDIERVNKVLDNEICYFKQLKESKHEGNLNTVAYMETA